MKSVRRLFAKSTLAAALGIGFFLPSSAFACNGAGDEYIGSICYMAIDYCPQGYLPADGRILNITSYQALYSIVGYTYGGTPPTTFALPNLSGRTAIGTGVVSYKDAQGNIVPGTTRYLLGKEVGQEQAEGSGYGTVLLSANQLPPHSHNALFSLNATSKSASLPLSGSINALPLNTNATLSVSGIAKIGSSTTTGRNVNLTDKALLTTVGGPAALLYAPAGATNDRQLGPDGSVTGAATGNISATLTGGTLSGNATGPLTLPVEGNITVVPTATTPQQPVMTTVKTTVPVRDPSLPLTACIAINGIYPSRP